MEPLHDLASSFLKRVDRELGRETTLQLMWPHIVGRQLAENTMLQRIHGGTLVIAVPDRAWVNSLRSMSAMVLDAVNRLGLGRPYDGVDFVAEPMAFAQTARGEGSAGEAAGDETPPPKLPELRADVIADPELRKIFMSSLEKYFSRGEHRK